MGARPRRSAHGNQRQGNRRPHLLPRRDGGRVLVGL